MVCPAISSYSFGATALIFCRMFKHIMEVCMSTGFWWSDGGIICVLQTHFIFKKSLLTKQLCPQLSSAGHTSFLVFILCQLEIQDGWYHISNLTYRTLWGKYFKDIDYCSLKPLNYLTTNIAGICFEWLFTKCVFCGLMATTSGNKSQNHLTANMSGMFLG